MLTQSQSNHYCLGLYNQIHELVTNYQTWLKFLHSYHKQPPSLQLGHKVSLNTLQQAWNWYIYFWKLLIPGSSGLPLQVSCDQKTRQDDSQACDKPHARHVFRIWKARHLVSDIGPCYNAIKFSQAMEDMGVHHIPSWHIIISPMDQQESMINLWMAWYWKSKKQVKIHILPWCYTGTLYLAKTCNLQWYYCVPGKLDLTCQCHK